MMIKYLGFNKINTSSLQKAIIYMLIGVFLLDIMGIIIKSMDNKYSVMQYAVARNFFGLFPLIVYLIISYDFRVKKNTFNFRHKLISIIRGLSICSRLLLFIHYELRVCNSSNPCIFYANFLNSLVCSNTWKCCWLLEVVCRIIRFFRNSNNYKAWFGDFFNLRSASSWRCFWICHIECSSKTFSKRSSHN